LRARAAWAGAGRFIRGTATQLPAALNRGLMAAALDTVWYLRRADARAWAIPLTGPTRYVMADTPLVDSDLFFDMSVPRDFLSRRTDRAYSDVQYHVQAFAVTADGRHYILSQALRWPSRSDTTRLYRPELALVLYDRLLRRRMVYQTSGEVRRIAVAGPIVYLLQRHHAEDKVSVVGVDIRDLSPGGG
jgi:hypothetical protein